MNETKADWGSGRTSDMLVDQTAAASCRVSLILFLHLHPYRPAARLGQTERAMAWRDKCVTSHITDPPMPQVANTWQTLGSFGGSGWAEDS